MSLRFTEFAKLTCCCSLGIKPHRTIEAECGKRNHGTTALLTKCYCILVVRSSSGDFTTYLFSRNAFVHAHLAPVCTPIENFGMGNCTMSVPGFVRALKVTCANTE